MTITAPDFEAAIDAAPRGDASTRFAYADWLEEQGDAAGARFQRWMGEWRRGASHVPYTVAASWYDHRHSSRHKPYTLPSRLFDSLEGYVVDYEVHGRPYPARIAAEDALRTALEAVDYEVTW